MRRWVCDKLKAFRSHRLSHRVEEPCVVGVDGLLRLAEHSGVPAQTLGQSGRLREVWAEKMEEAAGVD